MPSVNDIAVVTSFFNYCGYVAPRRNLRRWQRQMTAHGLPVYGVEIVIPNCEPVTRGWIGWRQLTAPSGGLLWQKESAINLCVKTLHPRFTKIVACDSDVFFDNPNWLAETSAVLNVVNACSPYRTAHWTDKTGAVEMTRSSIGADPTGMIPAWRSHPGFAMAMTRDFWDASGPGGIYPHYIVGSGDTALGAALCKVDPRKAGAKMFHVGNVLEHYMKWYSKVRAWNTGLSYVSGNVWHEYHGSKENRQYVDRLNLMSELDPALHLRLNSDGLIEWTEHATTGMRQKAESYFSARKEDE